MSIYYKDDFVELHLGDCLEVREWLAADVLVTDPPYGRGWRQGQVISGGKARPQAQNVVSKVGIANDDSTTMRDAALEAWGTERMAILFGDLMLAPPAGTKLVAIYAKPADSGLHGAINGVRRDAEAIYLMNRIVSGIGGRSSIFRTRAPLVGSPNGIVTKSGGHPHAKALDTLEELISLTTGIIADPFAGSGSTLVAAKALGRQAIGVELEERYCEMAARRLTQGVLDFGGAA